MQSSGNKNNEIERLTRSVIGEAKTGAPSFRNLPVRLSIPALFAGFSCFKSLRMVAGATGAKEKFLPLKGPVKLIKRVKIAHSFLQSVSDQFHVTILSLPM